MGERVPARYLSLPRGGAAGARVGLLETQSDVDACAAQAESQVTSLEADIVAYLKGRWPTVVAMPGLGVLVEVHDVPAEDAGAFAKDQTFYKSWRGFVNDDWEPWRRDYVTGPPGGPKPISILSADVFRECQRYGVDIEAWRTKAKDRGVSVTAPATTKPAVIPGVTSPTNPDAKPFPWGAALLVAGLIGVALVLSQVRAFTRIA